MSSPHTRPAEAGAPSWPARTRHAHARRFGGAVVALQALAAFIREPRCAGATAPAAPASCSNVQKRRNRRGTSHAHGRAMQRFLSMTAGLACFAMGLTAGCSSSDGDSVGSGGSGNATSQGGGGSPSSDGGGEPGSGGGPECGCPGGGGCSSSEEEFACGSMCCPSQGGVCVHDAAGQEHCESWCDFEMEHAVCGADCCPASSGACVSAANGATSCISVPPACTDDSSCACVLEQMPELAGCIWTG